MAKNPTGLSLTRSSMSMKCGWSKGETYSSQQFQYKVTKGGWTSVSVSSSATSKSVSLSASNWYPNTDKPKLTYFKFRVRGKKGSSWSDWKDKEFEFDAPKNPSVSVALDSQLSNKCTFSWTVSTSTTDHKPFKDIQYQSMLLENCSETDGSKLTWKSTQPGWKTGTSTSSSSSVSITESTNVTVGSHTRWFRIRSRGAGGYSDWKYKKHVYAPPNGADVDDVTVTEGSGTTNVQISWDAAAGAQNPIDATTVEYVITTPAAGLTCPSGANWQVSDVSADTKNQDYAYLNISDTAGEDTCLFVRVNTTHDNHTTYGAAQLAKIGYLKSPTLTSAVPNYSGGSVVFTVSSRTAVPGAYIECFYKTSSNGDTQTLGTIANGYSTGTFTIPDLSGETSVAFGIRSRVDGSGNSMYSSQIWTTSSVPIAPTSVTLSTTSITGTINVRWAWTWEAATGLELSWSDHEDAWYSTDAPESFMVRDRTVTEWHISGLETGKKWYVRIRLMDEADESVVYTSWSDMASIDLSSQPLRPTMTVSEGVFPVTGEVTLYWTFLSSDSTNQIYAEICEATISNNTITYGTPFASVKTAQQITIPASTWTAGTTHNLCVRTLSGSNQLSEWSAPVAVTIATPLTAVISSTSLSEGLLTTLPMTVTVTGAGDGGTTVLAIERRESYYIDRPDETNFTGYQGETIVLVEQMGEDTITISRDMLIGSLDDNAPYTLVATVKDGLGQTDETTLEFDVDWAHQAEAPTATVTMVGTAAKLNATAPSGYVSGDTVDIYRLSADMPELIIQGGEFGTDYVDPYPANGGGYRFVTVTANGDYITANNELAWVDVPSNFTYDCTLIDFNGVQIPLKYNLELSNTWSKDFQQTRYLGGATIGDWNAGVSREISVSTVAVSFEDAATIAALRDLAEYDGICNIRTLDGSSFKANLEVSETRSYQHAGKVVEFTISGQRIDPVELDGMTYEMWNS